MDSSAETLASPPAASESAGRRRPWGRLTWLVCAGLVLAASATWGGLYAWRWYQARHFRQLCLAARHAEDWHALANTAREWAAWDPAAGKAWWFAAEAAQELEDLEDMAACLGNVPAGDPKVLFALV